MEWMGVIGEPTEPSTVDLGDAATWVGVGVALLFSVIAAVMSWRSLRWERTSAESSARSADAAERANRLTERLLERESIIAPARDESDVSWSIEHREKNRYVLRNTGTSIAEDVNVDEEAISVISRNLPKQSVVRPGEGVDFLMVATWGNPIPNQIYVQWRGHDDPVAVPVPQ